MIFWDYYLLNELSHLFLFMNAFGKVEYQHLLILLLEYNI